MIDVPNRDGEFKYSKGTTNVIDTAVQGVGVWTVVKLIG